MKLKDIHLEVVKNRLEEKYRLAEKIKDLLKGKIKWKPLPKPQNCETYAVDGSRMAKRFSGVIIYMISSVAFGSDLKECTYSNILSFPDTSSDDRLKLYMQILETKLASVLDSELIIMDGSLSKLLQSITISNYRSCDVKKLVELIEDNWEKFKENIANNEIPTGVLAFEKIKDKETALLCEKLELLFALDKLLQKNVVYVAKTFYNNNLVSKFTEALSDIPVIELLAREQFGFEKEAYFPFSQHISTELSEEILDIFQNVKRAIKGINSAYIRFQDYGNIYLLESNCKVDDNLVAKLLEHRYKDYLFPLFMADRLCKIKKEEFDKYIKIIVNTLEEKYLPFLRYGRESLEV